MGGYENGFRVLCRVLNGCKIVNLIIRGHDNHSAGVLTSGPLNSRAADGESVFLSLGNPFALVVHIMLNIAVCGFFGNGADSTCLEHVLASEKGFGIFMGIGLVFT